MDKHQHKHAAAKDRRAQFVAAPRRRTGRASLAMMVGAALLFVVVFVFVIAGRSNGAGNAAPVAMTTGADVVLDAAQFDDGQARFFTYAASAGREVRFFVMKSADGVVRAAFDSCDVCYRERKGYRQVGNDMVCNNCGKAFPSDKINVLQGGCNPAPIDRQLADGKVTVSAASLDQGTLYF